MSNHPLTDAEKSEIAELAADLAYKRFYASVGESIIKKALWVIGAGAVAVWVIIQNGAMPK